MTVPGHVYLVGAGPGDPGLLTLRGLECLRRAEAVIYDSLANPDLLQYAPATAERIYVGKRAGCHSLPQDEINALLVRYAQAGRQVVRLKGGDPFVFGRGGEEALALQAAGIPFEVIPGVTSGIAVPAYAGIPVTQRGLNTVLTFVTGHEDPGKTESTIDWQALARGGGTLVFYMGVGNLPDITRRLLDGGRPPTTPAAIIRDGTLPTQEVITGTLETLTGQVADAGIRPPAIIIVGEVVGLRPRLGWFEAMPLFGQTVVVTRSRTQASDLAASLAGLGARVIEFSTIEVQPATEPAALEQALAGPIAFDWVIFTSVNAVEAVFTALANTGGDARRLGGCAVAAIGPATVQALLAHGIRPDQAPEQATSRALFEHLCQCVDLNGKRILLPRADIAPAEFPDALRQSGARVTEIIAYRTVKACPAPDCLRLLRENGPAIVTFTSSSTARNFAAIMREHLGAIPANLKFASIGPETSRAAKAEGMTVWTEAAEHTIGGLVSAIVTEQRKTGTS